MNPTEPSEQNQPNTNPTPAGDPQFTPGAQAYTPNGAPDQTPAAEPAATPAPATTPANPSLQMQPSETEPATTDPAVAPATEPVAPVMPSQPAPASGLNVPKKKRSKLPWIIGGITAGLLLLGGGAFAANQVYQSPDKVMSDAVTKLMHAEAGQIKLLATSDAKMSISAQNIAFKSFSFDTNSAKDMKADANAKAVIGFNGNDYEFAVSGMLNDNGDIYFKVVKAVDTLEKFYDTMGGGQKLPADALKTFRALEGKWVKVTLDDIRKNDAESADAYKCVLDAYKAYGNDQAMMDEVFGVYKQHQFVKTEGGAKYKAGMVGYDVKFDEKVAKEFSKAIETTAIGKKVKACDKSGDSTLSTATVESTASEASKDTATTTTVWVDQWSHELRKVSSVVKYTPKEGDASTSNIDATFGFDKNVGIAIPTDTMSIDKFIEQVNLGYSQLENGMSAAGTAQTNTATRETAVRMVQKKAEAYNALTGTYPATIADFEKESESSLSAAALGNHTVVANLPTSASQLAYKKCAGKNAAQIVYLQTDNTFASFPLGDAPKGTVKALC